MNDIDITSFDFADFGCSNGSSIQFGIKILKGRKGFGIDIDPKKVASAKAAGYDAIKGDFCNLDLPDGCVDFTILSHTLEHLPTLECAKEAIKNAIRVSRKFVFIRGPFFDADDYLKSLGLKFYWSDWTGHTLHLKAEQVMNILEDINAPNYEIYGRVLLNSSIDATIHPLSSLKNQHQWELEKHGVKPILTLTKPVYREVVCIIWLAENVSVSDVRNLSHKHLLYQKGTLYSL
ncbi:MAG TPA: class I SAM-dependent methyltransferase [Phormidium sp.]